MGTWWRRYRPSSFAIFAVATILVNALVVVLITDESRQRADQQDLARVERSVEACLAFNADQTETRAFEVEQILVMGRIFFGTTPEQEAALAPEIEQFRVTIAGGLPYRQCSVACVEARTDPTVADCPPSPVQEGTP